MKDSFASRLKQLREERGYTQEQLAKIINCSTKAISNYEQGVSEPVAIFLLALAQVLDVTPEYLLTGDDYMKTIYNKAIEAELKQIKKIDHIKEIKNENFNATILSHLQLTDELVNSVTKNWNDNNIAKRNGNDSYFTRPYVEEVIIKYCQNRKKYISKLGLCDGMLIISKNTSAGGDSECEH